jgi:hypothetical protein
MNTTLHFPDQKTVAESLSDHPLLKTDYFEEKGITKAIAELAAERFADRDLVEMGVKMGTTLIIYDLHTGKDGFSGKPLPNLGKLGLPSMIWTQISMSLEKALLDCAKANAKM